MDVNGRFNPMSDLFVAQFAKPAQVAEINLRALTPYQRALLVIDGTVTKFIEAYTMEPVDIIRLGQAVRPLTDDHAWLDAPKGVAVIARHVLEQGRYSQTPYAYAVSLIVPERIPETVAQGLEVDGGSLGRLLLGGQLETRREVLWYGKERLTDVPDAIRHLAGQECISRTYRIIAGGRPLMLINEKFPVEAEWLPSRDE
jgi:chorismate-pyruvate lyase